MRRHRNKTKPVFLIATLAIVALLLLAASGWMFYRNRYRTAFNERETAVRVLAEHVRKTVKPKSVLLISNPFAQMQGRHPSVYTFQTAAESGAKIGFGPETKIEIAYPKLRPEALDKDNKLVDPRSRTPLSFLVAENGFDEVIRQHPESDVIFSVIGMPLNAAALPSWNRAGPPRFALLLPDFRLLGGTEAIRLAFKSGKLVAAVIPKPKASIGADGSGDYLAEFQKRYILVTPENLETNLHHLFR